MNHFLVADSGEIFFFSDKSYKLKHKINLNLPEADPNDD